MSLSREYGVRTYGGHVKPMLSKHLAEQEIKRLIARGETNVWMVVRTVSDWRTP
jgi:hypothetical protein